MPNKSKSTELEVRPGMGTADIVAHVQAGGKLRLAAESSEAIQQSLLSQTVNATTADELFGGGASEVTKASELVGRTFRCDSVDFRNSDEKYVADDGIGIYAVLHIVLRGKDAVFVSGARDIVVKMLRATEIGALPRWLTVESSTTKSGYTVYNLVDAPSQSDAQSDF